MTETESPRKGTWWREVFFAAGIALVVSMVVTREDEARLAQMRQRAERAEEQLKQAQQAPAPEPVAQEQAPTDLVCPAGTKLQRVVSYYQDGKAKGTNWECIGKPRRVTDLTK